MQPFFLSIVVTLFIFKFFDHIIQMKNLPIYILVVILLSFLGYYIYNSYKSNKRERFTPERTFGLVLRSKLPLALKMKLNSSNLQGPVITGKADLPPLPISFDAREKWPGLITDPLNQGSCGSCWAFAIAMACSDRARIADPNHPALTKVIKYYDIQLEDYVTTLNNFSPWHLAACNLCEDHPMASDLKQYGICQSLACEGGILQLCMQHIKQVGMITADDDPRHAECIDDKSKCDYQCSFPKDVTVYKPSVVHQIDETRSAGLGQEKGDYIKYSLMNTGPLVVGYSIYQSFMTFFADPLNENKVYGVKAKASFGSDREIGGHAVTIMGWGEDMTEPDVSSQKYWLCRNSWSKDWNKDGYFKIARGFNFMGILDDVWSAHFSKDSWHEKIAPEHHEDYMPIGNY